jgi:hypothetical protein
VLIKGRDTRVSGAIVISVVGRNVKENLRGEIIKEGK